METSKTLIEVKNVCQEFHLTKGLLQSLRFEKGKLVKEDKVVHAVNDVSFEIKKGEVFTEENKNYYIYKNSQGQNGKNSNLTDEEVIKIRKRYVKESAREIYEDYKDIMSYQTLQQLLWGRHYSHLPIYKKKEKKWINI